MPTIVFASPKGGAGKSTAAVLLGTELAATLDRTPAGVPFSSPDGQPSAFKAVVLPAHKQCAD